MNIRLVSTSIKVGLLTIGLAALGPATGSAQTALPNKSAHITLTGCFLHEMVNEKGEQEMEYVLVRPVMGRVESVPEASCTSTGNDQAIELEGVKDHPDENHLYSGMVGRWIEVTGKLEKVENDYELREMNVKWFREVPVVPPRAEVAPTPAPIAEAPPAPAPPEIQPAAPQPVPVATTGTLPRTASSLPMTGLIGMLALVGAFALRLSASRRASQRG